MDELLSMVPRLHDWVGPWAMHEPSVVALHRQIVGSDLAHHVREAAKVPASESPTERAAYRVVDGVAQIDLVGTMMKSRSSFGGASTVDTRRAIRNAANDPEVSAVLMRIDSPGGSVAGTEELAREISAAKAKKTVVAFIEDIGASAAYWVASQATKVYTHESALVGSIGTYAVVPDYSSAAAREGIKVHVVRAGEFKGAGEPGTEITAAQLSAFQERIDSINEIFLQAVASGRGMSIEQVREIADGRVHVGQQAKQLGLVDEIASYEAVMQELVGRASKPTKGKPMSTEAPPKVAATAKQLKDAFPKACAEFVLSCLEQCMDMGEATAAYAKHLEKALDDSSKQLAAKPEQKPANTSRAPINPASALSPGGEVQSGSAKERFNEACEDHLAKHPRATKREAVMAVAKRNPELHAAYLSEVNSGRVDVANLRLKTALS